MKTVFLSYSTNDHFFAELATIKLAEAGIRVWRDQEQLRAGTDWRQGIEQGIEESIAVLVALSEISAMSRYVTYEWAYAMGKAKPVIPLMIGKCEMHPRLATIQYLTFINPGALPWASLVGRINEIETDKEPLNSELPSAVADPDNVHVKAILDYLNQRGYQMVSFERLRQLDINLTDERFEEIINKNRSIFRRTRLRGGKLGLAKVIP